MLELRSDHVVVHLLLEKTKALQALAPDRGVLVPTAPDDLCNALDERTQCADPLGVRRHDRRLSAVPLGMARSGTRIGRRWWI